MINVGVIGCGYWRPNLIRNFATCPETEDAIRKYIKEQEKEDRRIDQLNLFDE